MYFTCQACHAILFSLAKDISCLLFAETEKRKDSAESSTWALSNFLREVNQSKENVPSGKNSSGELNLRR